MRKKFALVLMCIVTMLTSVQMNAKEELMDLKDSNGMVTINTIDTKLFTNVLSINSSGKATVDVQVKGLAANQITIYSYLQQYTNGSWNTIKSWSVSSSGNYANLYNSIYVVSAD